MKFFFTFSLVILYITQMYSQDTIFLDDLEHITTIRDSADYFKIIKKEKDSYQYSFYTIDGRLYSTANLSSLNPEIKDGPYKRYFRDGRIYIEGNYFKDKRNGEWLFYNFDKNFVEYKKVYKNGAFSENPLNYYESGKIKSERIINDTTGNIFKCFDENDNLIKCEENTEEIMPQFNGDLMEYISKRMYYPSECRKKGIGGQVEVKFYVDIDGSIQDVHIMKSVHPLIDEQAKKIVSEMPKWTPGKQREEYVQIYYVLPLNYKLK